MRFSISRELQSKSFTVLAHETAKRFYVSPDKPVVTSVEQDQALKRDKPLPKARQAAAPIREGATAQP